MSDVESLVIAFAGSVQVGPCPIRGADSNSVIDHDHILRAMQKHRPSDAKASDPQSGEAALALPA
jgi:hypothetical protein